MLRIVQLLKRQNILMEGANGGEGSQGGGSPLDGGSSGNNGNGGNSGAGGEGSPNQGGAGGGNGSSNGDNGAGQGAGASSVSSDWKTGVSKEVQDKIGNFGNFKTVEDLAKAYVNATSMVGADKIVVPGKGTTPEQWKEIHKKLGLPEKLEDFKFDLDKDVKNVDANFLADFKKAAHAAGILPHQAKAMADWFGKTDDVARKNYIEEHRKFVEGGITKLKEEWAENYDKNIVAARKGLAELIPDATAQKAFKDAYGNDPTILKLLSGVGALFKEGGIKEGSATGGSTSPEQAKMEIAELTANTSSPYHDEKHPEHEATKRKVQSLYALAYPGKGYLPPTSRG